MLVAQVLSDLNSLQACGSSAARALVHVPQAPIAPTWSNSSASAAGTSKPAAKDNDTNIEAVSRKNTDLERAYQLLHLHHTVKLPYVHSAHVSERGGDRNFLTALDDSRNSVKNAAVSLGLDTHFSVSLSNKPDPSTEILAGHGDGNGLAAIQDDDEDLTAWS